jgi:uncharacterized protein YdiU (UPF0061 family)
MSRAAPTTLSSLRFDNRALRELPLDPEPRNFVRGRVAGAAFSRVEPAPLAGARLVVAAPEALALLGVADAGAELARADAADLLCGNARLPGSEPAAHCYCGHQFGHFSGQLGDGATMYLGECLSENGAGGAAGGGDVGVGGARGAGGADASAGAPGGVVPARWELQFKGAGRTPYSRTADGRKVLRSSLREFLCSEAHAALGIATTRSASVVVGDTRVVRDEFYSGRPREERCAVITRIAPTFLRFGSFEVCRTLDPTTGRAGPSVGRTDLLRRLLAFTCRSYFPEIYAAHPTRAPAATAEATASGGAAPAPALVGDGIIADEEAPERYLAMFREVCLRTARLCAQWQVLGWCHGVLNTDNMSIVGVTVDYGRVGGSGKPGDHRARHPAFASALRVRVCARVHALV